MNSIFLLGFSKLLRHVLVWVTKMDDFTVQFDQARFEEIKKAVTAYLKDVGYKQKDRASIGTCSPT